MATVRKTITLTEQQNAWIAAQVDAGSYTNDSEAIRDLIRRAQERGLEIERLHRALIEGEQSGEPEPFDIAAFKRHKAAAWLNVGSVEEQQAMRYTDPIGRACIELAEAPEQAQGCADIRPGYRRRGVGQHVVYFRPTGYGIAVIRILHQRMDATRHL